jgi:hypothetical protein
MNEDMFKDLNFLSSNLTKGIDLFIDRLDMTQRDRELFYDIINFTYLEGKIQGKEDYLTETSDFNNKSNEK